MGYDEIDRALLDAWRQVQQGCPDDIGPDAMRIAFENKGMATYARPLRSWALVLRADDKRIVDDDDAGSVTVDAELVRMCCGPVAIDYPGVPLDEAADLFGVNRTTVARWANPEGRRERQGKVEDPRGVGWAKAAGLEGKKRKSKGKGERLTWWQDVQRQMEAAGDHPRFGRLRVVRVTGRRLMLEHEVNHANPKRGVTRVWTPTAEGLDPGGDVWSAEWGQARQGLAERLPEAFEQRLKRVERGLGGGGVETPSALRSRVRQWGCPREQGGCGGLFYKLYLPLPTWSLLAVMAGWRMPVEMHGLRFRCKGCAGLVYESAERSSSPGVLTSGERRRVDAWDRFVKRVSGGLLTRRCVERGESNARKW